MSLYADDNTTILTDNMSLNHFFNHVNSFQKLSGSKINFNKSCGMFLGKWKTREDHPFGISWVQNCKLLGYKFGYNLTLDDIWNPLFIKFNNTLNLWSSRPMSMKGKSSVLNTFAISKIFYYLFCQPVSSHYIKLFQKACFKFIWGKDFEPIARKTLYLPFLSGGLNVPDILSKIKSFFIKHISCLINNTDAVWKYFAIYWIGLPLRKFNSSFASNLVPHSDYVPPFYKLCLKYFTMFLDTTPISLDTISVKTVYLSLTTHDVLPKCCIKNPHINFKNVFSNLFSNAIDSSCRNTCFKLIHGVLYTNVFLKKFKIIKSEKCTFCNFDYEHLSHLFLECSFVSSLRKTVLYILHLLSNGNFKLSQKSFQFLDVNGNCDVKYVYLVLLSEYINTVWYLRNEIKVNKRNFIPTDLVHRFLTKIKCRIVLDFNRLDSVRFKTYYQQLCIVDGNTVKFFSILEASLYMS